MTRTRKHFFLLAIVATVIVLFSGCEKPSFTSVTGKWRFDVRTAIGVLNLEDTTVTEENMLCYKDSCYYWFKNERFSYKGVIKKTNKKHVYDIYFLEGKAERVKIEQWPDADYLVILPEHKVVYDQRINVIEKKDHETKLQLYIGYGIKELDDITFIPESGADTIVSIYIEGIKK